MYRVMHYDHQFPKGQFPKSRKEYFNIQTHSIHETLKEAKKVCCKLGHTGKNSKYLAGYPPLDRDWETGL